MEAREEARKTLERIDEIISRLEDLEELTEPEFPPEAVPPHRHLTAEEIGLASEFEQEAAELLDPEAYAEIVSFSANEKTTYSEYWDWLRELRAALEEAGDGLRKAWLRPTGYEEESGEEIAGGSQSELPGTDDVE